MKINYNMYSLDLTGGVHALVETANRLSKKHDVSLTILERRNKIDIHVDKRVRIHEGEMSRILKVFDPFFYIYSGKRFRTDPMRIKLGMDMLGIDLDFDLEKRLYSGMPEVDVNVATHALTAFPVYYKKAAAKIFHMQHFETMFAKTEYDKKRVIASYSLPLTRIANSSWLQNKLKTLLNVDSTHAREPLIMVISTN
jgi:hypothetical protein